LALDLILRRKLIEVGREIAETINFFLKEGIILYNNKNIDESHGN